MTTSITVPGFERALSTPDLLASLRAFSKGLEALDESHGNDPEVAAVCRKWASRVAEIERHAGAL